MISVKQLVRRRDGTDFPADRPATPPLEDGAGAGSVTVPHHTGRRGGLAGDLRTPQAEMERLIEDEHARRVAAEASAQQFRGLVHELDAVVWEADGVDHRTTFVGDRTRDIFGYEPDAYLADPKFWEKHVHPDDHARAVAATDLAIHDLRPVVLEYRFLAADGRYVWINDRVRVSIDPSGQTRLTGVMIDISERKGLEGELARQALEDALTGLPNRALFMDRLDHALAASRRRDRRVAVLVIDIDDLKLINDTLGHEAGDEIIREVARRLKASSRACDTVARLGGDEFSVLLDGPSGDPGHVDVAARFAARIRAPIMIGGREVPVTASFGMALSETDHPEPEEIVRRAGIAMYRAKDAGGDRIVVYEAAMSVHAWARLDLRAELQQAVERGEFRVVYQPIIDLASGRVAEVEALVRWQHPRRGLLAPGEFIALAEETGLIGPISQFVLEEACRQVCDWQEAGASSLALGVNLSARQFQGPGLVEQIAATLERTGLPAESLRLEITETVLLTNSPDARETLHALRVLGVQVVLDDFGTGYSSLGYLRAFRLDGLKIDRTFVGGLGQNAEDEVIVAATIAIARAFNLRVTAEGIETEGQLQELRRLECDQVQGYLFSPPVAPDAMTCLLIAHHDIELKSATVATDTSDEGAPVRPPSPRKESERHRCH